MGENSAAVLIAVGILFGPGIIAAIVWLRRARKFRAAVPALIRAAKAMSDDQIMALTEDQFSLHKNAVDYGLRYKSGALAEDPEMSALGRRFAAEDRRRFRPVLADFYEKERMVREAAADSARNKLGL